MNQPLLKILVQTKDGPGNLDVYVEDVQETAKDERGGCVFRLYQGGKKFFLGFDRFSFV